MDDIQSWWEVPSIAHFCSLFRAAFNLLDFDIEELEEALLTDGAEDSGSSLLQELIVRLLCGCLGNNDISTFNYQMFLRRLFRQKCQEYGRDNPFNTDIDFQFLPLRTKVEILHALCDFRLDAEDVQDLLKNLESDSLRVEPLGHDENHSAYWYFYGTRLYREDYPKVKKRAKEKRRRGKEEKRRKKRGKSPPPDSESDEKGTGIWQVVCFTEQDWDKVTESFRDSTSKNERALFHTLAEDFLPEIPRLFAEKERLQRKRLLEYQPRRQSSRLEKLKQQKEEEEKMLQREEEERLQQEREKKERLQQQEIVKESRANRALMRSLSRTNSECGSTGSIPDSLTDNRSNRSSTFVGRQTNNSLSSATGQIVIQGLRRKLRSSQVFKQTEEDLQTGMYKILEHIKNHDDAWPFADPVDEDYAPRYYSIIRQPMDLQRMEDKLDEGEYLTFSDFKADFQLIVDNCRQYNGTDNEYTEMVGNLQEAFQMAVERYLESDPSSDEEVAVEFPTGATSSESRTETQSHRHKHHHRTRRKKEKSRQSSHINRNIPSPESEHTMQSSTGEEKEEVPSVETREKEQEEKMDHTEEGGMDTEGSSTKDGTNELKRPHSHNGTKRRKKTGIIKNVAAIEALELATEQTLKDINKWLDDTPRFSEFSSASNSPSHLISAEEYEVVGSRIENEYRRSLKLDRDRLPSGTSVRNNKDNKDMSSKRRSIKDSKHQQRRREIQRTIERLQPGKSKGNLISNIQSANKAADESGGCSGLLGLGGKPKENRNSLLVKTDEATPKLSLGTVLTTDVLGFGVAGHNSHNFDSSEEAVVEDKKPDILLTGAEGTSTSPRDIHNKLSPEKQKISLPGETESPGIKKEDEKTVVEEGKANSKDVKQEKVTPNLSAWFKAFGAPKTTVVQKQRKPEVVSQQEMEACTEERRLDAVRSPSPIPTDVPSCSGTMDRSRVISDVGLRAPVQEDLERKVDDTPSPTQQPMAPAQRQRKVSTGSSMSERSSFSQDPMDPLDGYPAPYPSPLHRSPMAASPVMASPRPEDTPKPTASYPPLNGTIRVGFYQDTSSSLQKSSPEKSNSSCSPQSPSPFQQPVYSTRYPPPHDTTGYITYRNPTPGPPQTYDGMPVPPYGPVMQYYDTSKPLTDQYRAARTQASEEYIPGGLSLSYSSGQQQGYPSPTSAATSSLPYSTERQSGFQLSVPRPSPARRSPTAPATSSGLLGTLPYSGNQQQAYDISVPRPSALHKPSPSAVTSSLPYTTSQQQGFEISIPRPSSISKTSAVATVPSTALPFSSDRNQGYDMPVPRPTTKTPTIFPVKKRLYSEIESSGGLQHHHPHTSRLHPSPPSPVSTTSITTPTSPPEGVSQHINLHPHTTDSRLPSTALNDPHMAGRLDETSPGSVPQQQHAAVSERIRTSPVSRSISSPQSSVSQVNDRLLSSSKQQNSLERSLVNPTINVDGAKHADSMLQPPENLHQTTGSHMTDRLYSEEGISPTERMHRSGASPIGSHQTSSVPSLNIQQPIDTTHSSRQVSNKQPSVDQLRQSPTTMRGVGNDISFHRRPFSPAAPSSISNLTNLSHIVDRFPSDGPPFYTSGGDKNRMFGQGSVQPPISSAAAAMAMFSQPAPTISYNRSVPELSSVLSGKVSDVQSVYSRTVPELSSVLPGKSTPPLSSVRQPSYDRAVSELSNYSRQTVDMPTSLPNKATPPVEGQPSYNHSVTDLSPVLTNKVPPATAINVAAPTYGRSVVVTDFSMMPTKVPPIVEASPLTAATPTPKPSRKRKTKQQQVTSSSETSVSSSSVVTPGSTTAFQQYVSEPSAIALKTVQTSVVPGSAFNFGPATSGLGLYGDAAGFLDEYRSPPTGYFISPGTEPGRDKQAPAPPAPTPFPFLGHPQARPPPTYPPLAQAFINHQPALMDASGATTPLYQQYLQRHQEELLRHSAAGAPMVLHQGLLAPPSGYPPGYHPALGIRQPYDALNRPSWL